MNGERKRLSAWQCPEPTTKKINQTTNLKQKKKAIKLAMKKTFSSTVNIRFGCRAAQTIIYIDFIKLNFLTNSKFKIKKFTQTRKKFNSV